MVVEEPAVWADLILLLKTEGVEDVGLDMLSRNPRRTLKKRIERSNRAKVAGY